MVSDGGVLDDVGRDVGRDVVLEVSDTAVRQPRVVHVPCDRGFEIQQCSLVPSLVVKAPQIPHFVPSLNASSLRSDVISSIKIISSWTVEQQVVRNEPAANRVRRLTGLLSRGRSGASATRCTRTLRSGA